MNKILSDRTEYNYAYEISMLAEQVAFWSFQAFWHRAKLTGRDVDKKEDHKALEGEFEQFRIEENKGRCHAEDERIIGS